MTDSKLHFGGRTTDPELRQLLEAMPPDNMVAGTVYAYEDLEVLAGSPWRHPRFRTVITRWRRKLLVDHNVDTRAVPSVGIEILRENDRVSEGLRDSRTGVRKLGRAVNRIGRADRKQLDDHHAKQQDHAMRVLKAVEDSAKVAAKEIASAGRIVPLPSARDKAASK